MQSPFDMFRDWYLDAESALGAEAAQTMCLATAGPDGSPDARMVLLKGWDERGFVFFTNLESAKGRQLAASPKAALVFHWSARGRQVRIRGEARPLSAEESDRYFATRSRASRIAAWASAQSRPLDGRETLLRRVAEREAEFAGREVPRPPFWGGYRLAPAEIEFWTAGEDRLHDRRLCLREGSGWTSRPLYP